MINIIKRLFGKATTNSTISISDNIIVNKDLEVSTKKDFIGKLDRIYFDKSNPENTNVSTVQFKQNTLIKRIQLQVDKKLTGSALRVYQKNLFGDVIKTLTDELELTQIDLKNKNFVAIELNYIINETSIIVVEQPGSGKGSGILHIEYFEN